MAAPPPGVAFLSSVARLEHPREGDNDHLAALTFDALLPCRNNCTISPIVCNARYVRRTGEHVEQGIYQVFLQVIINHRHPASSNVPLSEIIPYEPNLHLPSPVREDHDFTFLAEIITVRMPMFFHVINMPHDIFSDAPSTFTIELQSFRNSSPFHCDCNGFGFRYQHPQSHFLCFLISENRV